MIRQIVPFPSEVKNISSPVYSPQIHSSSDSSNLILPRIWPFSGTQESCSSGSRVLNFWEFDRSLAEQIYNSRRNWAQKSIIFYVVFSFSLILASKLATTSRAIAAKSPSWGVPGRLGEAALASCPSWLRFGSILGRFISDFKKFLEEFWDQFRYFSTLCSKSLGVFLHCFLYLLRSTTNPQANICWPSSLRGAIRSNSIFSNTLLGNEKKKEEKKLKSITAKVNYQRKGGKRGGEGADQLTIS